MSDDDKKRDRALQRRVRERQAKTGESYQAAWRQLTGTEAPTDEAPPDPAEEGASALSTSILQPEQLDKLVKARVDEEPTRASRSVLSIYQPHVPPHQPTRVIARPKERALDVDRIVISSAGTEGGASDWIVNDIEVDGRSQLAVKDLSGAVFGTHGVAANSRATTRFAIEGFDPVERDHELAIIVTYVGPNPDGIPFYAAAMGVQPPQRPTVVPIASKLPLPYAAMPNGTINPEWKATVNPERKVTITARVHNAPFQVDRLEIDDGPDWIVEDLRVDGSSQFQQSGGIPGDYFSTDAIDTFVRLETCSDGGIIEIDVAYVGLDEGGRIFSARLEGTVERDDYSSAPPDLRVIVEVAGQGPGEVVIGTCNWRDVAP
jgi:hypothetical protein